MTTLAPLQPAPVIDQTAQLLLEHYVFPDVAEQIAELVRRRLAEGAYAVDTAEELGQRVTTDLQSVNHDRHLRLKYHAEPVPQEQDAATITALRRDFDTALGGVPRVESLDGGVAMLTLAPMMFPVEWSGERITAAFTLVAGARALIIDLRSNRGGDPNTVAFVCSYLLDERTHLHTMYNRDGEPHEQSWSLPYVPGTRFGGSNPLYVLTSGRTFSGGEELAYELQQLGRAVIVGETTGGGAHPRRGWTVHPHLEATIPVARPTNPISGTNWEGTGVRPDVSCAAADALDRAHAHALARLTA